MEAKKYKLEEPEAHFSKVVCFVRTQPRITRKTGEKKINGLAEHIIHEGLMIFLFRDTATARSFPWR